MKLKTVKRMNACILSAAMVLSGVTIIICHSKCCGK